MAEPQPRSIPGGTLRLVREHPGAGASVLPFGVEPEAHAWLHAECWPAWHQRRQAQATAALREMGIYEK